MDGKGGYCAFMVVSLDDQKKIRLLLMKLGMEGVYLELSSSVGSSTVFSFFLFFKVQEFETNNKQQQQQQQKTTSKSLYC